MFVDEHEQESVEMRRLDWSEAASYHDWTHSLDYIIATGKIFHQLNFCCRMHV